MIVSIIIIVSRLKSFLFSTHFCVYNKAILGKKIKKNLSDECVGHSLRIAHHFRCTCNSTSCINRVPPFFSFLFFFKCAFRCRHLARSSDECIHSSNPTTSNVGGLIVRFHFFFMFAPTSFFIIILHSAPKALPLHLLGHTFRLVFFSLDPSRPQRSLLSDLSMVFFFFPLFFDNQITLGCRIYNKHKAHCNQLPNLKTFIYKPTFIFDHFFFSFQSLLIKLSFTLAQSIFFQI